MKRTIGIVVGVALLLLMGCIPWLKGDTGSSGAPGQDALISSNSYMIIPSGNPCVEAISEISWEDVTLGKQVVICWCKWDTKEWIELPFTQLIGANLYEHNIIVGDDYVEIRTHKDGALYVGDACFGALCMVIVQTFNH